jgi:hypothetical protein
MGMYLWLVGVTFIVGSLFEKPVSVQICSVGLGLSVCIAGAACEVTMKAIMDWSGCGEVEQVEGKVSGVPILKAPVFKLTSSSATMRQGFPPMRLQISTVLISNR